MRPSEMIDARQALAGLASGFRQPLAALAVLSLLACQWPAAPPPTPFRVAAGLAAGPSFALAPSDLEAARVRLAGEQVTDFGNALVGAASRWQGAAAPAAPGAGRALQALGDPASAAWPAAGLDLRAAPFNLAGDNATNGFASRNLMNGLPRRAFLITRKGAFVNLDPVAPTVGFTLTTIPNESFTKTYVTMAGNGSVAYVVSDKGVAYAVNVGVTLPTTPPSHPVRALTLAGSPTPRTLGAALFADPLLSATNSSRTTLFVCDNEGFAHRLQYTPGTTGDAFQTATFAEVGAPVQLSIASPVPIAPLIGSGTEKIMSPPVVLGGKLVVGDRAGYVITYDYNAGGAPTRRLVNYGWPIETPVAVDVDNSLVPTDYFAAAGAQLQWLKPDGTLYTGQYTLLEKGADDGRVDATTFASFVSASPLQLKASTAWTAFSGVQNPASNAGTLPNVSVAPQHLDAANLSFCEILSGLPPMIQPHMGQTGRPYYNYYPWNVGATTTLGVTTTVTPPGSGTSFVSYPVQDGDPIATAQLQSPSAIDFDTDGSTFVADTNHCQLLFNPKDANSWKNWFPAGATTNAAYNWQATAARKPDVADANARFYVLAGTLYPNAPNNDGVWSGADDADSTNASYNNLRRDVGNASQPANTAGGGVFDLPAQCAGAGTVARGSAINRVQGIAVGKLGLYFANRNAFQSGANDNGQVVWLPRSGLPAGTYWGIANPQAGRMYVICNFVDPQGLCVWKDPNAWRDQVFAPSMTSGNAASNRVLRLDSQTMTGATTMNTAGVTVASALNNPYDVCLDDDGNLFIAEFGASTLRMIARMVPPSDGVYSRRWGTAGVANTLYTLKSGMTDIASVTFAANDPQVPSGCLYIALGAQPGTSAHRIIRMDEATSHQAVAGAAYTTTISAMAAADSADNQLGDATSTRLAMPWRARGDGKGITYICDRGNNRIRKLVSSAGSSTATGYLCLPIPATGAGGNPAPRGKPVYDATLSLYSKTAAGALEPPRVGVVPPYLKGAGPTPGPGWSNATLAASPASFTPMLAPDVDLTVGAGQAFSPATTGPWTFAISSITGTLSTPRYQWKLPAHMLASSATDLNLQHVRLGLTPPADDLNYYYPTSLGTVVSPYVKGPSFHTSSSALTSPDQRPTVDLTYGNLPITYPILSPPTIVYAGATRYVYAMHSNALWRFDVTTPAAFITPTGGATAVFTRAAQARGQANGTKYLNTTFQFNTTPALATTTNEIFTIDIAAASSTSYSFALSKFKGGLASAATNMWDAAVPPKTIATGVPGVPTDNAGIYLTAADPYFKEVYFGLSNGRVFLMKLR